MITINVDQHWLDFNLAEITFIHIHTDNGRYKIFDSHAGDEYGSRRHPLGTCVLLKVLSVQSLVHYFQAIHSLGDNFKLRGAQNSTYEITAVNIKKNATAAALVNNAVLSNTKRDIDSLLPPSLP